MENNEENLGSKEPVTETKTESNNATGNALWEVLTVRAGEPDRGRAPRNYSSHGH